MLPFWIAIELAIIFTPADFREWSPDGSMMLSPNSQSVRPSPRAMEYAPSPPTQKGSRRNIWSASGHGEARKTEGAAARIPAGSNNQTSAREMRNPRLTAARILPDIRKRVPGIFKSRCYLQQDWHSPLQHSEHFPLQQSPHAFLGAADAVNVMARVNTESRRYFMRAIYSDSARSQIRFSIS